MLLLKVSTQSKNFASLLLLLKAQEQEVNSVIGYLLLTEPQEQGLDSNVNLMIKTFGMLQEPLEPSSLQVNLLQFQVEHDIN